MLTRELVEGADVAAGHELVGQLRLAHLRGAEHEDGVPGWGRNKNDERTSNESTGWPSNTET